MEEEKKDQFVEKEVVDKEEIETGAHSGTVSDGESEDESFREDVELPKELRGLTGRVFRYEEELEAELLSRGFSDLPVVLDPITGKARLRIPSGAHNTLTTEYAKFFEDDWKRVAAVTNSDNNVFIQPTAPGRKIYVRQPDIAFWGPEKSENVTRRGRTITMPKKLLTPPKRHATRRDQVERVNPDVVIQFSWTNGDSYEEKAIDDMMNRGSDCVTIPLNHIIAPQDLAI